MQYHASLSRQTLEPGAALFIQGNSLVTQDTLKITLPDRKHTRAVVTAFGLGRLVVTVGRTRCELQPWLSGHDRAPDMPPGAASRWTVRSVQAG